MTAPQRVADAAAAVSFPAWLISLAADTLPLIQWLAGAVAITAGVFAIVVHRRQLKKLGEEKKS